MAEISKAGDASEAFDLCIIGAGIAGLNALYVAQQYLPKGARVALIDRNKTCGGMWNAAYDFVRLHQPHPMFTTGDVKWRWNRPKRYLASRTEIQDHLAHCRDVSRTGIELVELYEHDAESWKEVLTDDGPRARVRIRPLGGSTPTRTLTAKHLINAIGLDIPVSGPMPLSSSKVLSTAPHKLSEALARNPGKKVYVVGGGKTGMDTVTALLDRGATGGITLINGKGTMFANRDFSFPIGARRWWQGKPLLAIFRDTALRFDGTNEEEVYDHYRSAYTIGPNPKGEQFFFGLLSPEELDRILDGIDDQIGDYLEDVVDTDSGPQLVLRSGERRPVEPGTIFVNCTGLVARHDTPAADLLSEHGAIMTISPRAAVHFLTSVSAYFLTHLLYLGWLPETRLFILDQNALLKKGRKIWHIAAITHSYLNTVILLNALPFRVLDRCGLDFDRWFPLPRRLAVLVTVKSNSKRDLAHCERSLALVSELHGITCAPRQELNPPLAPQ
ncbi:MAG: FAD-dependent oxidoreductase [Rhodobacteraceae bacterium]|nr:FAD-dependent oxidoreductase [Paracoccaceae bacterium]